MRGTWEEGRFAPTFTNSTARCRAPCRQRDVEAVIAAARTCGLISQSQGVEPSVAATTASGSGTRQSRLRAIRGRRRRGRDRNRRGPGCGQQRCHGVARLDGRHARPDPGSGLSGAAFHRKRSGAIDTRGDVDQMLLSAAVSGANGKSYSFEEPGNRVSMGSSHSVPDLVVVPAQPLLVRRRTSLCRRTRPACRPRSVAALKPPARSTPADTDISAREGIAGC